MELLETAQPELIVETVAPIEEAISEAVTEAVENASEEIEMAQSTADIAVEIAMQASDDAVLGDIVLAEEFRQWQETSEELAASQSAQILALQTTMATTQETCALLQTQLADCQLTIALIRASLTAPETTRTGESSQKPHTEEKPMEHHESAVADRSEPEPEPVKEKAVPRKRRALWA
jgi:hypothetical protein